MNGEQQADVVRALEGEGLSMRLRDVRWMSLGSFDRCTHAHEGFDVDTLTDPQQTANRSIIIIQGKQRLTVQARFHFKNKQASSDLSDGRDGKAPSGKKEPQKRTTRAP